MTIRIFWCAMTDSFHSDFSWDNLIDIRKFTGAEVWKIRRNYLDFLAVFFFSFF